MYIVADGINLKEKSREELIIIIQQYMDMERRNAFMEKESSRAQSAMAKEFQLMKKRMEEALSENQLLKEQMARLAEQNCRKTRDVFGRRTEKLSDLLDSTPARDEIDEAKTEELSENTGSYVSYQTLENENPEAITVSGCMMHMRRRYAQALALIDTRSMPEEKTGLLPEVKALEIISRIYKEEGRLKGLDPQDWLLSAITTKSNDTLRKRNMMMWIFWWLFPVQLTIRARNIRNQS